MTNKFVVILGTLLVAASCNRDKSAHDASGVFEAAELTVFAEASGKLEIFNLKEGDRLAEGQPVGYIDSSRLRLKKMQLLAAQMAMIARRPDVAATQKQATDADSLLCAPESTSASQTNARLTSASSFDEEGDTFRMQIEQVNNQLAKCRIVNPVEGTVLSKYIGAKEIAISGKPLYRIADTRNMFLRAYVVSEQLDDVHAGQPVTVFVALSDGNSRSYSGKLIWISDKAELTPKTIQTQAERQQLVYAVKIKLANTDGLIKTGMYGDVDFTEKP